MIKVDFHLFTKEFTIGDKTYSYSSKGGRIMALYLIAGFIAKRFGYLDWPTWVIIGASIGACLLWDIITMLVFDLKMKRLIKKANCPDFLDKQLYTIAVPKSSEDNEMFYIIVTDEDGGYLVVVDTTKNTELITGIFAESIPTIFNAAYVSIELSEIINIVKRENYVGMAYIKGEKYTKYPIEELENALGK